MSRSILSEALLTLEQGIMQNMKKIKQRLIYAAFSIAVLGVGTYQGLFNHKPFVDFVFGFGDVENQTLFMPEYSGITYNKSLPTKSSLPVPADLLQPSGISISDQGILIVADTSDVFWLDFDGNEKARLRLEQGPLLLRQGLYEGVTWVDQNTAAVIGNEGTTLTLLEINEKEVRVAKTLELSHVDVPAVELQSIAFNQSDKLFHSFYVGQEGAVHKVTINSNGLVSNNKKIDTSILGGGLFEILGASWSNDTLLALTNNNLIIAIENNVVKQVWALDYAADTSGAAVYAGSLFLVTDHEYYQAQPPLMIFDLPSVDELRISKLSYVRDFIPANYQSKFFKGSNK